MSCYGCICNTCANNEERMDKRPNEAEIFCYTCDDCKWFTGAADHHSKWKRECKHYKVSEHEAQRLRKTLKLM